MKTIVITIAAWLAMLVVGFAQSRTGPPSMMQMYGTNPTSPPGALGKSQASTMLNPNLVANTTGNTTANGTLSNLSVNMTVPSTGGVPGSTTAMPAPAGGLPTLPVLTSLPEPTYRLPATMEAIDNEHKLGERDQMIFQIAQDRDKPQTLFVDEEGKADVPWLGRRVAKDKTLHDFAYELKKELDEKYYYNSTVLIAPYRGERSRGEITILGQVLHPGSIPVPPTEVLTLWDVIVASGGFSSAADASRVAISRRDRSDPEKVAKTEIDVAKIISEGRRPDQIMQPGDFIFVPATTDTSGYVTVTGEVHGPGLLPLPSGRKMTVAQAVMLCGGFTEWANHDVLLVRYVDGKRTEKTIDVDAVFKQARPEKDADLQADDRLVVKQTWFRVGG